MTACQGATPDPDPGGTPTDQSNQGVQAKDWWYVGDFVTVDFVDDRIAEHGARILDLEAFFIDGQQRFAIILVPARSIATWRRHARPPGTSAPTGRRRRRRRAARRWSRGRRARRLTVRGRRCPARGRRRHARAGGAWSGQRLTRDYMVTYRPTVDEVFRAIGDPTRRLLLDRLFERDGRTLTELEAGVEMTRFGVMKHLRVLEGAGLVLTRRRGREKLHFLNPVPIRLVHDRWVSKYAAPWASALSDLKRDLEGETMEKVFEIYIKTTPERLWRAITDPERRRRFSFGVGVASAWTPGSTYTATTGPETVAPGMPISEGENLEVEPPRRLVQSFRALWGEDVVAEGTSRVTWEIEPVADSCRLTVTHDQLRDGANEQLFGGWPMILSGLKTLLETGETLTTPGSLMYLAAAPTDGVVGPATSRQMAEMPGRRGA